ncbi:MAG: hypothetical protein IPJ69_00615 [Deltaproteobacteria bacterium]|nr:MAG: hypothetical protein IPJ69_00615 [Deltaproteobacteria bacterium]
MSSFTFARVIPSRSSLEVMSHGMVFETALGDFHAHPENSKNKGGPWVIDLFEVRNEKKTQFATKPVCIFEPRRLEWTHKSPPQLQPFTVSGYFENPRWLPPQNIVALDDSAFFGITDPTSTLGICVYFRRDVENTITCFQNIQPYLEGFSVTIQNKSISVDGHTFITIQEDGLVISPRDHNNGNIKINFCRDITNPTESSIEKGIKFKFDLIKNQAFVLRIGNDSLAVTVNNEKEFHFYILPKH